MSYYYTSKRDKEKHYLSRYILRWSKKIKLILLKGGKCEKCGISDLDRPWIYQFHHINDDKEKSISEIRGLSFKKMKDEIQKCICVCENCHRKIHSDEITIEKSNTHKCLLLSLKNKNSCEECGYDECIKSLDFHHNEEKDFEIADIITKSYKKVSEIKEDIIKEIEKCSILCANCHRDKHNDAEKFQKYKKKIFEKAKSLKDNYSKRIDHNKILELNKKGYTQKRIAEELGCNDSTVCGVLKMNGIHTFKNKKILDVEKIIELRNQGKSNPEIAKILNCHRFSIANAIKRYKKKNSI